MRTPNTSCMLCDRPLYRRPSDTAKSRYAACLACRGQAQKAAGITDAQIAGLERGRVKGTNHRAGYRHREESKQKASASNKRFAAENPEAIALRSEKTRGEQHYRWKGGASKLNTSIRQMHENRKWMDAVKARDGACVGCGGVDRLESHHKVSLADLISSLGIICRDDARRHGEILWDLTNGETLCERCHYARHGRELVS